jgi:hypothetical protein
MMYHRERLAQRIANLMGSDTLIQIARKPRWGDSLNATRARLAVRDEHRTLYLPPSLENVPLHGLA